MRPQPHLSAKQWIVVEFRKTFVSPRSSHCQTSVKLRHLGKAESGRESASRRLNPEDKPQLNSEEEGIQVARARFFRSTTNQVRGCENSIFSFQDFCPSDSRYSFDSWFTIFAFSELFAFSEQSVIHESNAASQGFASTLL